MGRFRSGDQDLRQRTMAFSLEIIDLVRMIRLRRDSVGVDLSRQLLNAGTSVGANIAEADGAQSRADFAAKCVISLKEGYETRYWLHLLHGAGLLTNDQHQRLVGELTEIIAILNTVITRTRITPTPARTAS